ncbi:hypothetical protein VNO80_04208 [Phaseolus coccineus]|uniref:Uncharacterized protein n=1 Tax=Phaseolus coccineus TaxID=3886 RepID=A0AAN9NTE7_PHACN
MQTLQREGIASESHVAYPGAPAESTSTNWYNFSSITPNLPGLRKGSHYNSSHCTPYATSKKRVFLTKRAYSTRTRGRSGVLQSLSRKLGRFKIRTVTVQEIATEQSNPKQMIS